MHVPVAGTVDHYRSFKNYPHLAYEWDNYRFASSTLNQIKQNADDTVLDPHEVQAGWFEILLPSLQLQVTDKVPPSHRAKAEHTLVQLKLRDDERLLRWRHAWYHLYLEQKLTLEGLRQVAPLIAAAVERAQTSPSGGSAQ